MADEKAIDLDRLSRFYDNLKSNVLPLNNWQANKKYKVGYTVIQDGKLYRCKTEHTSTTTFDATKFTQLTYELATDTEVVNGIFGGASV